MTPHQPRPHRLTRRSLLAGAAAAAVLAACGDGGAGPVAGPGENGDRPPGGDSDVGGLVRMFRDGLVPAGRPGRLPFALADAAGIPLASGPARLPYEVLDAGDAVVAAGELARHGAGIPRAYYPLRFELAEAGVYDLRVDLGAEVAAAAFTVAEPGAVPGTPFPGDPMFSVPTPTDADPRGVDPICTRQPACPFHDVSLDEALEAGRPLVLLISTPAFCPTGICGPTLDLLLEQEGAAGDAAVIHAEVYDDETATQVAPAVAAAELQYEPSLFVVDAGGTVLDRLDYIYDADELAGSLALLT